MLCFYLTSSVGECGSPNGVSSTAKYSLCDSGGAGGGCEGKNIVREKFLLAFLCRRFVALRKPGSRFKSRKRQKILRLKLSRKLYVQFGSNCWLEDLSLLTWTDTVCSNPCTRDRFGEAMKVSEVCREKEEGLTWMYAAPWVDQISWRRDKWFGVWARKRLLETVSFKFCRGTGS